MESHAEENQSTKGRKSRAAKTPSRKVAKVKASLMLTEDVDFRLTVHAAAMKLDRSELANQILDGALKRYVVQDRGQNRGGDAGSEETGSDA
jgi:hypothetical protein